MLNSNADKKRKIIFSPRASSVISQLIKKWGLIEETAEESLEKLAQGKIPIGAKLSTIIKKLAEKEITTQQLNFLLQKKLNLSVDKAKGLSKDIVKEVLVLANEIPKKKKKGQIQEKRTEKRKPKEKISASKDIYRELIE